MESASSETRSEEILAHLGRISCNDGLCHLHISMRRATSVSNRGSCNGNCAAATDCGLNSKGI